MQGWYFIYPVTLGTPMLCSSRNECHICNWYGCCFYRRMHAFKNVSTVKPKKPTFTWHINETALNVRRVNEELYGHIVINGIFFSEQSNLIQYFRCFILCFWQGCASFRNELKKPFTLQFNPLFWIEVRNKIPVILNILWN